MLGVVLLESTLRELGFAQVSSSDILLVSGALAFVLTVLLGALFSRMFTQPITAVQRFAGKLAGGEYEARMNSAQRDEIGELARSMDILARRLFEARSRDERLREQQSAFFATISHELKTPVTVIRGSLEALRDGVVSGGDDVRAYYNQMLTECKGLQRLIIDLLELSRLQNADFSLNMGSVDVRELLGDVAMSAGALCSRKGVRFDCREPGNALQIVGDYARLRQMLLVVLDNAVKFTPEGKRVSLALEGKTIVIADEGIGIPAEELAHIFDRFRRTRRSNEQGTGLGLAICSEVARRHGIAIDVASRVGRERLSGSHSPTAGHERVDG